MKDGALLQQYTGTLGTSPLNYLLLLFIQNLPQKQPHIPLKNNLWPVKFIFAQSNELTMAYWSPAEPLPDLLGFPVRWMLLFQMNSLPNAHLWLLIEPHWVIIGLLSHELASAGTWVPSTGVQSGFGPLPSRFNHRVRSVIACAACLCCIISNHGY